MRYVPVLALALPLLGLAACGSSPSTDDSARSSSAALSNHAPTPAATGDSADTSCQVVLRDTFMSFEGRLGPETDCSSGTCWVIVWATIDVAMTESLDGAQVYVFYQGGNSTTWQQSAAAEPLLGAPVGYRRYQVALNVNTFLSGNGAGDMQLIPYIQTTAGARLFDHNRVADPLGAYQLVPSDNWTIADDATACPGATPPATLWLTFATGWTNITAGSLVPGGKLDVTYDIYRMPQTLGCTTDGVDAFATTGYVQFQPSGQVLGELLSGPFDSTTGQYDSLPLEFDVPAGTTSAALWFEGSSDCAGGTAWDSNYGQNYVYNASAP
jgi:hypothetical protein